MSSQHGKPGLMSPVRADVDRAGAVRAALVRMVAQHGFHGASMGAVAKEANVGTGTAYLYYASKDELVYATYLEVKRDLVQAAVGQLDPALPARERFTQLWRGAYEHLAGDPDRARFLIQVESSPFATPARDRAMAIDGVAIDGVALDGDPLLAVPTMTELVEHFVALPLPVLYDLAVGPILRLIASGTDLDIAILPILIEACWRAVTN